MDHNPNRHVWYQLTIPETFKILESSEKGLTTIEAKTRLDRYGPNELTVPRHSWLARLIRQFHNPLVYILLAAATVTSFLSYSGQNMWADTAVIVGVVILNAILGFFQEGKAENALNALAAMMVPECQVLRDGKPTVIEARELVPGDIVLLSSGDWVPADLRMTAVQEATTDESVLTGESLPVVKKTNRIDAADLSPGDQLCIAFSGTFLARGNAHGVVIATAEATEFGRIAALVKKTQTTLTPLQKKIEAFTKILIITILGIGVINFALGWTFGYTPIYSFLASVSLVVAAIPEMLPMIVTGILALAATKMARRNALIRRLPAAETLGCTTVICSDKTGTLTKNQMTVTNIFAGGRNYDVSGTGYATDGEITLEGTTLNDWQGNEALRQTLIAGLMCNNSILSSTKDSAQLIGDPTEGALLVSALKMNLTQDSQRLDEIPFDSQRMFMATLHKGNKENIIFLKGSPEQVVDLCSTQWSINGNIPLEKKIILAKAEHMAQQALRVIGMACMVVTVEKNTLEGVDLSKMVFLGLQGMIDPPRPEAIEAITNCAKAGIRAVMITGDHLLTAKAVAQQLGIIQEMNAPALSGTELTAMTDDELRAVVDKVSVYARVAPEHKLRITQQLRKMGEVVAMTGDGVNDAPSLKAADIGIAMGITGTEVSKEASSMLLTDDNFATIVAAVEEGRHAWNNLEKAILYTLPTNSGQALLVMGAVLMAPFIPLFEIRLPLEPVQILWVNLLDSVFLTMPLMMEGKSTNILGDPPRNPQANIANRLFLQRVILIGLAIALPGFAIYFHFGSPAVVDGQLVNPLLLTQAQTAAFWAVLLVHIGFVMSARSVHQSAFTFSPFSNRWLLAGILASILIRLLPTFNPFFSSIFRTAAFPLEWWWIIIPCLLPGFIMLELHKWLCPRIN
jgi:P-type Ca2+ transporter type 2C